MAEGNPIEFTDLAVLKPGIIEAIKLADNLEKAYLMAFEGIASQGNLLKGMFEKNTDVTEEQAAAVELLAKESAKLKKTQKELLKAQKLLEESNEELIEQDEKQIDSIKDLKKAVKTAKSEFEELSNSVDGTSATVEKARKTFTQLQSRLNTSNKSLRDQAKTVDVVKSSYRDWEKTLTEAQNTLKELPEDLAANSEEAEKLKKVIIENRAKLKDFDAQIGNFQRSVGDYENSITRAARALNNLGNETNATFSSIKNLSIGIGVAAGGLGFAFSKTEEGGESLRKAMEALGAVVDLTLVTVGKAVSAIGKQIEGLLLKTSPFTMGDGTRLLAEGTKELNEAVSGFAENIQKTIKSSNELTDQLIEFEKEARVSLKTIAELNKVTEEQTFISDDATRGFEERNRASLIARKSAIEASDEELKLARKQLEFADIRLQKALEEGRATKDLRNALLEANLAFIEADKQRTLTLLDNTKIRRELRQDEQEIILDILLDDLDNQKTINERIIANDRFTVAERKQLLEATRQASEESFAAQTEVFQTFVKSRLDINKLLAETDQRALQVQLRGLGLSEILITRLQEVLRERRLLLQDLTEATEDLTDAEFEEQQVLGELAIQSEQLLLIEQRRLQLTKDLEGATSEERLQIIKSFNQESERIADDFGRRFTENELDRLQDEFNNAKEGSQRQIELQKQINDILLEQQEDRIDQQLSAEERAIKAQQALLKDSQSTFERILQSPISDALLQGLEKTLSKTADLLEEQAAQAETQEQRDQLLKKAAEERIKAETKIAVIQAFTTTLRANAEKPNAVQLAARAAGETLAALTIINAVGFEKGGLVEGGEQIVRINEKGPEFVVDARTTKALGLDSRGSDMSTFHNVIENQSFLANHAHSMKAMSAGLAPVVVEKAKPETIDYDKLGRAVAKHAPENRLLQDNAGHLHRIEKKMGKTTTHIYKKQNKPLRII